jgi:hypothetical protein
LNIDGGGKPRKEKFVKNSLSNMGVPAVLPALGLRYFDVKTAAAGHQAFQQDDL